ncbi:flagellar biosynthesis protein FlhF [Paenibacillus sp. FJAT-26967]|uniref:flagellar biosynthesis protein FlhF n=1 Tax=Paenibacillus sp. FJAT-26967 TaxID=1729690 RepID=UPI000838979B|nr:flagellar biosynthesis protein FlhF [Paenibacillus sp. FJAT-26967]
MRVKRYIVDSMPDALNKIRSDLGKDAVILNTKEVRTGGFLGFFGKKRIEVIAAVEEGQPAPAGAGYSASKAEPARSSSKAAAAAAVTAVARAAQQAEEDAAHASVDPSSIRGSQTDNAAAQMASQPEIAKPQVPARPIQPGLIKNQELRTTDQLLQRDRNDQQHGVLSASGSGEESAALHTATASTSGARQDADQQLEAQDRLKPLTQPDQNRQALAEQRPAVPREIPPPAHMPQSAAAAAYAQAKPVPAAPPAPGVRQQPAAVPAEPRPEAAPAERGFADAQAEALRAALAAARSAEAAPEAPASKDAERDDLMLAELQHLKRMMADLARPSAEPQLPPVWRRLEEHLLAQEVLPDLVRQWTQGARIDLSAAGIEPGPQEAAEAVRKRMLALFPPPHGKPISAESRIVHIVGPTGVGKTTTIAKLAADQVLKQRRKVGLITSDTYRIAAIEQLRTYANILDIPVEVVFSPADLTKALHKLQDSDVIFMDTAGRNFRNEMYVSELSTLLRHQGPSETFLVLSLTSKYSDMKAITANFSKYKVDKVLFTKMDETHSYGAILNLLHDFPVKLSYVTDGQNVPDDIMIIDEAKIADAILEEYSYE